MPRKRNKRKNNPDQVKQAGPQLVIADGGEEMGHESKLGDAMPADRPAVDYHQYSVEEIVLFEKALDSANYAIRYLRKEALKYQSDIIAILQALQDISNCIDRLDRDNIDEELYNHAFWDMQGMSRRPACIADRLVTAHSPSLQVLLESINDANRGYLLEWCRGFKALVVVRIASAKFKELKLDPDLNRHIRLADIEVQLNMMPASIEENGFDLPRLKLEVKLSNEYDRFIVNMNEVLHVIQEVGRASLHRELTRQEAGVVSTAAIIVQENIKQLPLEHALRIEGSQLREIRNRFAHSPDIKRFLELNHGYFYRQYIAPFMAFGALVRLELERLSNSQHVVKEPVREQANLDDGGQVSYLDAHMELFITFKQRNGIKKGVEEPRISADGKIFDDEELRMVLLRTIQANNIKLFQSIIDNLKSYTAMELGSMLNIPLQSRLKQDLGEVRRYEYATYHFEDWFNIISLLNLPPKIIIKRTLFEEALLSLTLVDSKQGDIQSNARLPFIRKLLDLGANPNTPLLIDALAHPMTQRTIFVSPFEKTELFRLVLENGVNPNMKDAYLFKLALETKPTYEDIKLFFEHGIHPNGRIEFNEGRGYTNVLGAIVLKRVDEEEAYRLALIVIQLTAAMYGMPQVSKLLRGTCGVQVGQQKIYKKKIFLDELNDSDASAKLKGLINIVSALVEQGLKEKAILDGLEVLLTNNLESIRAAFEQKFYKMQALINLRLNYIKASKTVGSGDNIPQGLSAERQDAMVNFMQKKIDTVLPKQTKSTKYKLVCTNYYKDHEGHELDCGRTEKQLDIKIVENTMGELGFDFIRFFCDANVAEQVIAWSKHGIGNLAAPALELKDDGMKAPQVSFKMTEAEAEATATNSIDVLIKMAAEKAVKKAAIAAAERAGGNHDNSASVLVASARLEAVALPGPALELKDDDVGAKESATVSKVVSIEERVADDEVSSIMAAAARLIVVKGTSAAGDARHTSEQISMAPTKLMVPPTSAPTPSPTVISHEVVAKPRLEESVLVKYQDYEDESSNSESVPALDWYDSVMMELNKAHQTVRIAGSVGDTIKLLKDPNVNTIIRAATGYGHIAETFGKNLGMKYLAPIGIGSQLYQEDYTGAAKSTAMLLGRMVPVALMPVAPAVAVIVKVGFIGYDTYKVYQDMVELRDLICGQMRGDDESGEL